MNLGVETSGVPDVCLPVPKVSAFSDESWGGDPSGGMTEFCHEQVSAFSDESWGGDPVYGTAA